MSKYNSRACEYKGIKFPSHLERRRYIQLELLEKSGQISNLRTQVKYELIPKQKGERKVEYVADFVYEENGETVVEDTKGYRTQVYVLKRKLMLYVHGIRIREVEVADFGAVPRYSRRRIKK